MKGRSINILIVDDESSAVQAVQNGVCWDSLDFSGIYTASSMAEAIDIIQDCHVDVLLCDIEMPMGSGLELLKWVKDHKSDICCILMTCHADFGFAQEAVRLGTLDYILKPLDFEKLEKILQLAVDKVSEKQHLNKLSSYWSSSKKDVVKQFWKDFLLGDILPNEDGVLHYCNYKHLDIFVESLFLPIIISVKQWDVGLTKNDQKLFFYALRNIIDELMEFEDIHREVFPFHENAVIIILNMKDSNQKERLDQAISYRCSQIIDTASKYIKAVVCCYVGGASGICGIPAQVEILQTMDLNNVVFSQNILFISQYSENDSVTKDNGFAVWWELFRCKGYDRVLKKTKDELLLQDGNEKLSRKSLDSLYYNFYFMLIDFCQRQNILLKDLFGDEMSERLSEAGKVSVDGFIRWVEYALKKVGEYEKKNTAGENPVEQAKQYVKDNLSNELSIEEIAAYVYLSADYLTKIFKKEEGMTLHRYVIKKKMERAMWLLKNTQNSIGDIASLVGYYNYSSFARCFLKEVGKSPQEYKADINQ
ncbi:MAG TPA: response regulator [Clostridiales bacterium]|nr:response regulator [Clostridiales bacterium]